MRSPVAVKAEPTLSGRGRGVGKAAEVDASAPTLPSSRGVIHTETSARLGSERANVKKKRQALPAAVLRILYRAVR